MSAPEQNPETESGRLQGRHEGESPLRLRQWAILRDTIVIDLTREPEGDEPAHLHTAIKAFITALHSPATPPNRGKPGDHLEQDRPNE